MSHSRLNAQGKSRATKPKVAKPKASTKTATTASTKSTTKTASKPATTASTKPATTAPVKLKPAAAPMARATAAVEPKGGAGGGAARPTIADPIVGWRSKITSHLGHRESPGGIGSTNHKGIDIGAPTGTPIHAIKDGTVVSTGPAGGYGNLTVIKHDDGTFSKYAHQSEINVRPGQEVKAGDVIGKVGSTGNSTGPHLHLEVRRGGPDGEVLDPEAYLNGSVTVAGSEAGPAQSFGDNRGVGGGNSPSGMRLGSGGSGGGSGGSSGGSSGGGSAGGGSASSGASGASADSPVASSGSPVVSGGSPVAKGDFAALLEKLRAMGIDEAFLKALSEKYGVPIEVILAIMMQESGGNPNAKSSAGALGLMQLMPGTAAGLGVTNPLDPKQNLEGGVKYLAQMHKNPRTGGDWGKAFAMYNAGPAGNFDNPETQNYIRSVPQLVEQAKKALAA